MYARAYGGRKRERLEPEPEPPAAAAEGGGRAGKMGAGVFRVSETGTRGEREARVRRGARRRRGDPRRETERVVIRARSMR